jgi:hypothetical protein
VHRLCQGRETSGPRISNIQGIAAVIKIYDGGVASGDLTLSLGRDRVGTGTLQHCEFTVATVDFWARSRRLLGKLSRHIDRTSEVRNGASKLVSDCTTYSTGFYPYGL